MMLTNSISHQVSSPLTILAAQIVVSPTVLYGGVIPKATQFAMLVVSPISYSSLLCYPSTFWGRLGWTRVSQTGQAISFPFSLYSTFKQRGGCTFAIFLAFLYYNDPKSRVRVLAYSHYGSTACNAISMLIRLLNHYTGLTSNNRDTVITRVSCYPAVSPSPSSNSLPTCASSYPLFRIPKLSFLFSFLL